MKTYTVTIKTFFGKASYEYQSEVNENVNVMWNGEFQCIACNGSKNSKLYANAEIREVEGR